jgi:hypothetical protein
MSQESPPSQWKVGADGELIDPQIGQPKRKRQPPPSPSRAWHERGGVRFLLMAVMLFPFVMLVGGGAWVAWNTFRPPSPISIASVTPPSVVTPSVTSVCNSGDLQRTGSGKIAFISNREDEFGAVMILDPITLQACRLFTHPAGITRLVLAMDKSGFWYETGRGWWSANFDGSNAGSLTTPPVLSDKQVAPSGNAIVYDSEIEGNRDLYLESEGNTRRLTTSAARDFAPAWSPDGKRIVFVSYRAGNFELYMMNADGSETQRLTTHNAADFSPVWFR